MQAVVVDHSRPSHLAWAEAADPVPGPSELVLRVEAVSVNPGEITDRIPGSADGAVPGWEASGVVVRAAADGTGPAEGTRVATFGEGGGWAELRVVPAAEAGVMPPSLDPAIATVLPSAGVSALRAVRAFGDVAGRTLLVTGANGAVGRLAVQLGARAGARVVAVARDASVHEDLLRVGADVVMADPADSPEVDVVIDMVGGPTLVTAFRRLRSDGVLLPVGHSSHAESVLSAKDLTADIGRSRRTVRTFFMPEEPGDLAEDLATLGALAAAGDIDVRIDERITLPELPDRLASRIAGKLVATRARQ